MPDLVANALAILRGAKTSTQDALNALEAIDKDSPNARAAVNAVRQRMNAAQTQHLELATLLLRIERRQKIVDGMRFEFPGYWRSGPDRAREGPFCATCWESKLRASELANVPFRGHDRWVCRTCATTFFTEGAKAAMDAAQASAESGRLPGIGVSTDD